MSVKNGLPDGLTFAVAMRHRRTLRSRWVRLSAKLSEDECATIVGEYRADPRYRGWAIKLGEVSVR